MFTETQCIFSPFPVLMPLQWHCDCFVISPRFLSSDPQNSPVMEIPGESYSCSSFFISFWDNVLGTYQLTSSKWLREGPDHQSLPPGKKHKGNGEPLSVKGRDRQSCQCTLKYRWNLMWNRFQTKFRSQVNRTSELKLVGFHKLNTRRNYRGGRVVYWAIKSNVLLR